MKFKILMAAALVMAAACNQLQTVEEEKENNGSDEKVTVTVNVGGGASTRSTTIGSNDESAVENLQLFAFNSDGSIESYATGADLTQKLNVTKGTKNFVALVNCPDLSKIESRDKLMATVSLLENNSSGHFEMIGEEKGKVISAETSLNLTVKRIVSKVVIEKISADFSSPYLASLDFKVTGIFLTNVVASNTYALDNSNLQWVNQNKPDASNPAKALNQDVVDNYKLTSATPYSTLHTFYCYPNPVTADSAAATWSERYTRLVVQTTLGGTTGYYSIPIPNIGSNKIYTIKELKVTKRGSAQPYENIETADATFTIEVSNWEPGSDLGTVTL